MWEPLPGHTSWSKEHHVYQPFTPVSSEISLATKWPVQAIHQQVSAPRSSKSSVLLWETRPADLPQHLCVSLCHRECAGSCFGNMFWPLLFCWMFMSLDFSVFASLHSLICISSLRRAFLSCPSPRSIFIFQYSYYRLSSEVVDYKAKQAMSLESLCSGIEPICYWSSHITSVLLRSYVRHEVHCFSRTHLSVYAGINAHTIIHTKINTFSIEASISWKQTHIPSLSTWL